MVSPDNFDDPWLDEYQDFDITCRQCGATGLYWVEENGKWRLYDSRTDERHACITIRRRGDPARPRKV